tara:strand:+ start:9621 stop:10598 length:978 start_codon:yes stop_codon:yes gene_type:complete
MAKNQKEETVQGGTLPQVNIVGERTAQGIKYLDRVSTEMLNNPNYIPEHIQNVLDPWVRNKREEFDNLTEIIENTDKASDEYNKASREREKLVNTFVVAKNEIESLKRYTGDLKNAMTNMSQGTREENLYTNMLVGGAQADAVDFDSDGKLNFASVYGKGENDISIFRLDDMLSTVNGESPIITEPIGTKTFVWKMAENVKQNSDIGKPFDEDWTYTRVNANLAEGGPQNTIGVAFADLVGDNQSKSFAQLYEEGLKDSSYYTHPETGEAMPNDNAWMKDPNNADILQQLLGKYITGIMKDVHGEEVAVPSQSQLALDLIKKYKK